jgi:hydroxybutyrate-dimer hydrolase
MIKKAGLLKTGCAIFSVLVLVTSCGGGGSSSVGMLGVNPSGAQVVVPLPEISSTASVMLRSVTIYPATATGSGSTADTQDLLTAGMGRTGLGNTSPPAYAVAASPTALELRRNAIYSNYRAVLDGSVSGGYSTLYGPNVDNAGMPTLGEGLIPGREYIATLHDGSGSKNVVVAIQIPDSFNLAQPCIVVGPSSGSRGVYGAIGTAAEWGLKHNCTVALTDAGKGMGLHDLSDDTVNRIDGTRGDRTVAGALSHFAVAISDAARVAYNALFPERLALKQVHSQLNPEKDWGLDTLAAARYAIFILNNRYGTAAMPAPFTPANTLIIAGSISNGGAAVLHAGEQDMTGLLDGVVAGEPVTQLAPPIGFGVQQGGVPVSAFGRQLADYVTYGNIFQPCAMLADGLTEVSFFNLMRLGAPITPSVTPPQLPNMVSRATDRCSGLAAKGLLTGATTTLQAADALVKLRSYGWTSDHDQMHNGHYGLGNNAILSTMYPTGYGRFSVTDNLCATSFAQVPLSAINLPTDSPPIPGDPTFRKAQSFAVGNGTGNGQPSTNMVNNSVGGPRPWLWAVSPSTGVSDFGLDSALCLRALVTGLDAVTGVALSPGTFPTLEQSDRVRTGIAEVLLSGNQRGRPTLILAGRNDALIPTNHNSRAYVAKNRLVEGANSKLVYIEVTNAQHFDTFLNLTGWDTRFVPLHPYFNAAMDAMYAHLTVGKVLPPSQVVRTTPRGGLAGAAPPITALNVPQASVLPATGNLIVFSGTSINVPN